MTGDRGRWVALGVLCASLPAIVVDSAREAFVHAMSRASVVVALMAALGAVIAWRFLPAQSAPRPEGSPEVEDALRAPAAFERRGAPA